MGVLGNQPAREHYTPSGEAIRDYIEIAKELKVPLADVIKAAEVDAYQQRTRAMVEDGDYRDEQVGGIGLLLQRLVEALEQLVDRTA